MKKVFSLLLNYGLFPICENKFAYGQSVDEEELKNAMILSFGYTHIPQGAELDAQALDGFFVATIG